MDEKLADEVFALSIEAQRIENRKHEIMSTMTHSTMRIWNWDKVCSEAMKFKMQKIGAIS